MLWWVGCLGLSACLRVGAGACYFRSDWLRKSRERPGARQQTTQPGDMQRRQGRLTSPGACSVRRSWVLTPILHTEEAEGCTSIPLGAGSRTGLSRNRSHVSENTQVFLFQIGTEIAEDE